MPSEYIPPNSLPAIPPGIFNVVPEMIFCVAADGHIVEVNSSALCSLRVEREGVIHRSFCSFLDTSSHEKFSECLQSSLQDGSSIEHEFSLKNAEGNIFPSLLRFTRHSGTSGEESICIIAARDLSEKRNVELELLRFQLAAYHATNPISFTDPNVKVLFVNPAFELATGYTKDEIMNVASESIARKLYHKEMQEEIFEGLQSHKPFTKTITGTRKNGDIYYTVLQMNPVFDHTGTWQGYIAAHKDMTDQRFLEQRLIQAQKLESIGLLASGIAHEVGNPLTSIFALAQVLQYTVTDPDVSEKLETIKKQVSRITKTIRDMLYLSRKSSNTPAPTDVNHTVEEAVNIVRVGMKAKTINFITHLDPALPMIPLVADQLQQVFINILINAVDALFSLNVPNDPAQLNRKTVTITTGMRQGNVVIILADTGSGISQENISKIFDPFFTTKKAGEGTGLGLWITYGIIKSFNGEIFVNSTENVGTSFEIILPANTEKKEA